MLPVRGLVLLFAAQLADGTRPGYCSTAIEPSSALTQLNPDPTWMWKSFLHDQAANFTYLTSGVPAGHDCHCGVPQLPCPPAHAANWRHYVLDVTELCLEITIPIVPFIVKASVAMFGDMQYSGRKDDVGYKHMSVSLGTAIHVTIPPFTFVLALQGTLEVESDNAKSFKDLLKYSIYGLAKAKLGDFSIGRKKHSSSKNKRESDSISNQLEDFEDWSPSSGIGRGTWSISMAERMTILLTSMAIGAAGVFSEELNNLMKEVVCRLNLNGFGREATEQRVQSKTCMTLGGQQVTTEQQLVNLAASVVRIIADIYGLSVPRFKYYGDLDPTKVYRALINYLAKAQKYEAAKSAQRLAENIIRALFPSDHTLDLSNNVRQGAQGAHVPCSELPPQALVELNHCEGGGWDCYGVLHDGRDLDAWIHNHSGYPQELWLIKDGKGIAKGKMLCSLISGWEGVAEPERDPVEMPDGGKLHEKEWEMPGGKIKIPYEVIMIMPGLFHALWNFHSGDFFKEPNVGSKSYHKASDALQDVEQQLGNLATLMGFLDVFAQEDTAIAQVLTGDRNILELFWRQSCDDMEQDWRDTCFRGVSACNRARGDKVEHDLDAWQECADWGVKGWLLDSSTLDNMKDTIQAKLDKVKDQEAQNELEFQWQFDGTIAASAELIKFVRGEWNGGWGFCTPDTSEFQLTTTLSYSQHMKVYLEGKKWVVVVTDQPDALRDQPVKTWGLSIFPFKGFGENGVGAFGWRFKRAWEADKPLPNPPDPADVARRALEREHGIRMGDRKKAILTRRFRRHAMVATDTHTFEIMLPTLPLDVELLVAVGSAIAKKTATTIWNTAQELLPNYGGENERKSLVGLMRTKGGTLAEAIRGLTSDVIAQYKTARKFSMLDWEVSQEFRMKIVLQNGKNNTKISLALEHMTRLAVGTNGGLLGLLGDLMGVGVQFMVSHGYILDLSGLDLLNECPARPGAVLGDDGLEEDMSMPEEPEVNVRHLSSLEEQGQHMQGTRPRTHGAVEPQPPQPQASDSHAPHPTGWDQGKKPGYT